MAKMLANKVKVMSALDAVSFTATTNGIIIDTQGFESLMFTINVGDFATFTGTNKITVSVEEGDDSGLSDAAAIASGDYLLAQNEAGSTWDKIMDGATDDEQAYKLGIAINTKRYKRLVFTEGGTVVVPLSATAVLGDPRHAPAGETQAP